VLIWGKGLARGWVRKLGILVLACLLLAGSTSCGPPDEPISDDWEELEVLMVVSTADPGEALPSPLCPGPQPEYITDLRVRKPPTLTEPQARSPFRDEEFGTCLVRVTDREADIDGEDPSRGLKNEYSRIQSFNADGNRILVRSIEQYWYLYDAASLQPLGRLPLETEPRWDAQDPDVVYYGDETRLMSYNVVRGQSTVIHDFADDIDQRLAAVWTRHEGRPSMDSRFWGLMAEDEDWRPIAFVVYDRWTDMVTLRNTRDMPGIEEGVDHVTISPLGTYFLASFDRACDHGTLGDDSNPCGLMVYGRDLAQGRSLLRIIGHYDLALDEQGREVVLYQDIDTDHISMLDLQTGAITALLEIDYSHTPVGQHYSGLAYEQPGWGLVSTYSGGYPNAYTWMDDTVFAVELKAGGRVVRLAHTHSQVDEDVEHDYWAEPQATVNQDFTKVLFTSNWGRSGSDEVEVLLINLPAGWLEHLP
jgi:hypothetical protein